MRRGVKVKTTLSAKGPGQTPAGIPDRIGNRGFARIGIDDPVRLGRHQSRGTGLLRRVVPAVAAVGALVFLGHPAPPDPPHIDEEDPPRPEVVVPSDMPDLPNPLQLPPGPTQP